MSVLIKGMEMPHSCASCLWEFQNYCCLIHKKVESCDRHPDCPLVEVNTDCIYLEQDKKKTI